ncbi:hypothetical protein ACSBR1_009241 [Camellia fascicularis]
MAKQVRKTHDLDCCSRPLSPGPKKLSYNFLDVAFSPYNDQWLFVSELFSLKRVKLFYHVREVEIDCLIKSMSSQASPNKVNLDEKVFTMVEGIVCQVAFGKSYRGKNFEGQKFEDVNDLTRKKSEGEEDFVDALIGLWKDEASAFRLTKDQIKALLLVIMENVWNPHKGGPPRLLLITHFIGCIDTISVAMVWAMSKVVKNRYVMQKQQAEIRNCLGKKAKVEVDDLGKLTYLKMVVKETLRLHPLVPLLIPHETINR